MPLIFCRMLMRFSWINHSSFWKRANKIFIQFFFFVRLQQPFNEIFILISTIHANKFRTKNPNKKYSIQSLIEILSYIDLLLHYFWNELTQKKCDEIRRKEKSNQNSTGVSSIWHTYTLQTLIIFKKRESKFRSCFFNWPHRNSRFAYVCL